MCSDTTLEKVRTALKRPLLTTTRLKSQSSDLPSREVSVEELLSPDEHDEFVRNAFRLLFGREPAADCLANWQSQLTNGRLTREEIVEQLLNSEEGQLQRVRVHGLEYALATRGRAKASMRPQRSSWRERFHVSILNRSQSLSLAVQTDRKIAEAEKKTAALATECLEVVSHIEHRLNQARSATIGMHETQVDATVNSVAALASPDIDKKLTQIHQRIAELGDSSPHSELEHVIEKFMQYDGTLFLGPQRLQDWLVVGDGVHEILRACAQQQIEIARMATSQSNLGYTLSQGVTAIAQAVLPFIESQPSSCAPVVLLRHQLLGLADADLLRVMLASCRALLPGGHVIIEEGRIDSEFDRFRIVATLENCGFNLVENVLANHSAATKTLNTHSLLLLGQKPLQGKEDFHA